MPQTMDQHASAWAFILANRKTIERFTQIMIRDCSLSYEDFRGELLARIAETHHRYDPRRAGASTWIFLHARKVKRGLVRQAIRNHALSLYTPTGTGSATLLPSEGPSPDWAEGTPGRMEARADLAHIYARIGEDARVALLALAGGAQVQHIRKVLMTEIRHAASA